MKSFQQHLNATIAAARITPRPLDAGECQSSRNAPCPLCHARVLDYNAELQLKQQALQEFWRTLRLGIPLDHLVASPLGRHYRTTSKRRAFAWRGGVRLGLIGPAEEGGIKPVDVVQCAIEPQQHGAIFQAVQQLIDKPYARKFAKDLSYVVIKGNYTEQTVIFNLRDISSETARAANTLSKSLTHQFPDIVGVFVYEDDSSPQYYLGAKRQSGRPTARKLYGKAEVYQRIREKSFLYSPLSFSQINQSILDMMIQTAEELLKPDKNSHLYDLYCGYGVFSLCLAGTVKHVTGVELSGSSIESAVANAKRQRAGNVRFLRSDINEETIERIMKTAGPEDRVILDPSRKGTAQGVLEAIAARQPARVVHIFCEIDLIASELKRWRKSGYDVQRAIPFDMFPGTDSVEVMVLLQPAV